MTKILPHPTHVLQKAPAAARTYASQQEIADPGTCWAFCRATLIVVLVTVILDSQNDLSHVPPGSTEETTIHGSLCIFHQEVPNQKQAMTDLSLQQRTSSQQPLKTKIPKA